MIDFLRYRLVCAIFSVAVLTAFVGIYVYRVTTRGHAFNYSVDFTGGTQVLFRFSNAIASNAVKKVLESKGWNNPVMRSFSPTEILVRLGEVSTDVKGFGNTLKEALESALPDNKIEILSVDSVSGGIGEVLRWKSIYAVGMALLLMLIYIWFRFWSISFGLGAVVSLFHDAIFIVFIFLLFDQEISGNVITAILTVLGYSINDTIVIFNKIRQNMKTMKNSSMESIVNISINQTLRRTLLTSFATILVVGALAVLGGESLRDLSLALLLGMIFGTYSSIYIASPIMLLLRGRGI